MVPLSPLPHSNSIFICMTKHSNFCPELIIDDSIKSTEQLMNALLLNNKRNITNAVKAIAQAKYLYKQNSRKLNAVELSDKICLEVSFGGVTLKPYSYAAKLNRAFNPQKTFENYTQKQNLINFEFLTDYMVKFNGNEVAFQSAFYIMVEELMFKRKNSNSHVEDDSLIYEIIQPKYDELRSDSRNIIYEELNIFNKDYERLLVSEATD